MRSKKWKIKLVTRNSLLVIVFILFTVHLSLVTDSFALDVKRTVLPNGLKVLHVERHNLPIVMVSLLIKASPVDENPEKAGLANLTAELITEGTKKRSAADISEETEFIGASLKASVDSDYTSVALSVLKKDVEKGFDIFSDVLVNPIFPDNEIARNKELIKGGLKQSEEDPSFVAKKAFKKAVFGDLPYGRIIRGSTETIDGITRDDVLKFYANYYRPNNAVISVVGDLTEKELSALLDRFLSAWKPSETLKKTPEHRPEKARKTILIDRDITQANILLGHEGIRREDPDYYAVSAMNYILGGGGFTSRLMQKVRDEMGLAYDIHSYFNPNKYGGIFEVGVQTKNESANTVISEVLRQLKIIREEHVSEKELEDAKAYLTGSFPRRLDTNRKIADFLLAVDFYNLGFDYIEKYPQYINSVTKDDILRVAKKYLSTEDYILVVVANQTKAKIGKEEKR